MDSCSATPQPSQNRAILVSLRVSWMDAMADAASRKRAQRLRQTRRERGDRETNVWLPREIGTAIDEAVDSGLFPSRQVAITHALAAIFIRKELKTVT